MLEETFDVEAYLEDSDFEIHYEGEKNVSRGWLNINCIFCSKDPSWHLGINLTTKFYHCWICGESGPITKLIHEIEGFDTNDWQSVFEILKEYQDYSIPELKQDIRYRNKDFCLPKNATKDLPDIHRKYLEGRNFDPDYLIDKYDVHGVYNIGDYKFRLIFPVYKQQTMVSFQTRDVTGKASSPYIGCDNEESIIPIKNTVYNIDNVNNKILVLEGVFDVFRMGDGAVATYGTDVTSTQVYELVKLSTEQNITMCYILFDAEPQAQLKANELGYALSCFDTMEVEILCLDSGDPADLTDQEAREIRKELKL